MVLTKGFPNIVLQDLYFHNCREGRIENQLSAIITIPIIVQMSLYFYTLELDQLNAHGTQISGHINRSSKAVEIIHCPEGVHIYGERVDLLGGGGS